MTVMHNVCFTKLNQIFLILFLFFTSNMHAQYIDGKIRDIQSKESIPFASVFVVEQELSVVADSNGLIHLDVTGFHQIRLKIAASGYQVALIDVDTKQSDWIFELNSKHVDLQEITITGTSTQLQNQNPFHVETRKLSELTKIPVVNMGEAIARIPGVYQSSLGNGIAKPVIRGLQGMRIVSLVNGLRIEGQQWGGDHGMGMAELGIGAVEVIKGPASLLYGADALGGVIHYTDVPYAPIGEKDLTIQTMAQTNTMGGVTRVMARSSKNKLRWMLGSSYANHADFQLPTGRYAMNSRFNELVVKGSLAYNAKRGVHSLRYTYNHTTTGIPGHTHDTTATPLTFQVLNQKRNYTLPAQFFSNHYFSSDNKWYGDHDEVYAIFGFTSNQLIEYDEKVTIPSLSMSLNNALYHVKWTNKSMKNIKITSGIQGMFQSNMNAKNASDTLIPNSLTADNGVYSTLQYAIKRWNFQAGLRYDLRLLKSLHAFNGRAQIDRTYAGLNGSVGGVYATEKFTFRGSMSSGYRAPHLTELLSNGFHHGALRYEIGDIDLKPEYANQVDLTAEFDHEHIVLVLNPFVNQIRNYIFLQPMDSSVANIPVFAYEQASSVLFYGTDLAVHYHPHFLHQLHYEASLSFLQTSKQSDNRISLIPQPRIQQTMKYEIDFGKQIIIRQLTVNYTVMGAQNNVAYNETPSLSYHLLDAALLIEFNKQAKWTLNLGCKNILNTYYIDHLSRLKNISMPGPGRNFYLGVTFNLKNQQ